VARGDNVAVYAKVGLVTITATGIAQEDAELGQRLKVRSPSSGEVYSAAVSGRGEVMVRE
jgi:flagella basal body P-ring formation protein FlgA